jgi:hypothetical protein
MAKTIKFFLGSLALLACLSLQFWLVPFGIHADLAFAALVTFAFLFGAGELVVFVLLAVLVLNWQPGLSLDIIAFALIPLVVFFAERRMRATAWIGSMVAVIAGLLVLYLVIAPAMILNSFPSFFLDVVFCVIAGQIIFWGME